MSEFTTLVDGLIFAEGPRWHDGKLWFSDMHDKKICTVDLDGNLDIVHHAAQDTSGLGWAADGSLLFVSMPDRRLMKLGKDGAEEIADLSPFASFHCNDMIVDKSGRTYVGNFGFDLHGGADHTPANLVMVDVGGSVSIAASDLMFPNGMIISANDKTMIVAETFGACLTAFDIAEDGSLSNRRIWADIKPAVPDGICLDAEGAIWVASPSTNEVIRVLEGGEISDRLAVDTNAFACMLGGHDGKTLFALTAEESNPDVLQGKRTGKIEMIRVAVAAAGRP
ncbi:MAG: SMP-30/gluconolactonase/LRE family protein [Oceanicoccus sp.]